MQQSNGYIIGFAAAMTIILGGLLSVTAVGLKERQKEQIVLETKKQILSAVMSTEGIPKPKLSDIYGERIKSTVVDFDGNEIEGVVPENVKVDKEYKKSPENRQYPVFKYMSESNPDQVEAYILPLYGFGLWNYIWGYAAISSDLNTIYGISFDHVGETPGLGARITEKGVQDRYKGKKIKDESGEIVSVDMIKGEGNPNMDSKPHQVDGMSGATITGKGVNSMLKSYLENYEAYLSKVAKSGGTISASL
ncbi:NADH:ubiquinone reductase (Na(+)-transporting) subunit C [Flexithrix dorotheae]|uniref:NADH:ubiquinone reductase (Na(+)-transporting) subunit C n=1 Tax=Flexithrix dorotheae TaxID=70993 RepID=UPI0003640E5C|nr:NADH:ubiquinone reductase (Na(+)-transporting) subunit C [Flexithrix dorotheae]